MEMKDYLITEQVAEELGCTINRVYYLKNQGLLKPINIMDRYLYPVENVEEFKNQQNADKEKYLTTEQVAKELGCTINRVYYLRRKGLLKPIKIMDRYLYSVEDVERFKNQENAGNKESA